MNKKKPTDEELKKLNVDSWGTWSKEVSEFDWSYGDTETCYILDGEVEVVGEDGEKIEFQKLIITFPRNFSENVNCRKSSNHVFFSLGSIKFGRNLLKLGSYVVS